MAKSSLEYRARSGEVRSIESEDGKRFLTGYFSVTNEPYEIHERSGAFIETVESGAFVETLRSNRHSMKVLLEHGKDPTVADKPLGPIVELEEDERGARYKVELLDTSYNRDLIPALEAGLYSASFRFAVPDGGDVWNEAPGRSERNPQGLPERSITRVEVSEFGPVLWPANGAATASVRSMTDRFAATSESRAEHDKNASEEVASADEGAESSGSGTPAVDSQVRDKKTPVTGEPTKNERVLMFRTNEERSARLVEISAELTAIADEHGEAELPEEVRSKEDALRSEVEKLEADNKRIEERRALVTRLADAGKVEGAQERGKPGAPAVHLGNVTHDVEELRTGAYSEGDYQNRARENARRIVESAKYAHSDDEARAKAALDELIQTGDPDAAFATRLAGVSSEAYRNAFRKYVAKAYMTSDEKRAMSLGVDTEGGFGVPDVLDPTIIFTSAGSVNPLRQIANVQRITGKKLQLTTSAGITVVRAVADTTITPGESDPVTRTNPALGREEFSTQRVYAYMTKSFELEHGYASLDSQLMTALAEAKDDEEAASFITRTGNGLTDIEGLNTLTPGTANETLTWAAVFGLDDDLPVRHRSRAAYLANSKTYNEIRLLDENVGGDLWTGRQGARPAMINEKNAYEMSGLANRGAAGVTPYMIYGDFSKYLVLDRIGMVMKHQDIVLDTNGMPTGETGLVAFWWNGGGFIDKNAFRSLNNAA